MDTTQDQGLPLAGATVLVTGAGRGMGVAFVRAALDRGAARVWATARRPEAVAADDPRVVPLRLDVTDPASVAAALEVVGRDGGGLDLLVNNAGVSTGAGLVDGDLDLVRAEMDVHFWGPLLVTRAAVPLLARRPRSAVLDVLSALSFRAYPGAGAYAAAKAAAWRLTDVLRLELAGQGTRVVGLHVGAVDTDMMAGWDVPKSAPADVVRQALDGVEQGADEVLADEGTRALKALLPAPPAVLYAGLLGDADGVGAAS
jgi:NAD(P)-dependent dehydrogenase (short-subunit alcohol dehydrogenase family)